jgi:hypothetical protein
MQRLLSLIFILFGGGGLGLYSAELALDRNVSGDLVRAGPWEIRVSESSGSADPYARAERARSGAIPLASGEGFTLTARVDSEGRPLDAQCRYRVDGATPTARFWSVTLLDQEGRPVPNEAHRQSFSSTELTRDENGRYAIEVASEVRPGDWLPAPLKGGFMLLLRLYDTPVGAGASVTREQVPVVSRLVCA